MSAAQQEKQIYCSNREQAAAFERYTDIGTEWTPKRGERQKSRVHFAILNKENDPPMTSGRTTHRFLLIREK